MIKNPWPIANICKGSFAAPCHAPSSPPLAPLAWYRWRTPFARKSNGTSGTVVLHRVDIESLVSIITCWAILGIQRHVQCLADVSETESSTPMTYQTLTCHTDMWHSNTIKFSRIWNWVLPTYKNSYIHESWISFTMHMTVEDKCKTASRSGSPKDCAQ